MLSWDVNSLILDINENWFGEGLVIGLSDIVVGGAYIDAANGCVGVGGGGAY